MSAPSGYIILLLVAAAFLTGGSTAWYVKSKIDIAAQEQVLAAQIADSQKKQVETTKITTTYEQQLSALRASNTLLSRSKSHAKTTGCKLDADSIGLLKGSLPTPLPSAR